MLCGRCRWSLVCSETGLSPQPSLPRDAIAEMLKLPQTENAMRMYVTIAVIALCIAAPDSYVVMYLIGVPSVPFSTLL